MSIGRWFRDRPRLLEEAFRATHTVFRWLRPLVGRLGYRRSDSLLRPIEKVSKGILFDCQMCGQCVLHSTGMTCPMTCPKNIRNGPCGGVRANGNCEIISDMRCVWVEAFERAGRMKYYGDQLSLIQPPVNRRLEGASAWITMLDGSDLEVPNGWVGSRRLPAVPTGKSEEHGRPASIYP